MGGAAAGGALAELQREVNTGALFKQNDPDGARARRRGRRRCRSRRRRRAARTAVASTALRPAVAGAPFGALVSRRAPAAADVSDFAVGAHGRHVLGRGAARAPRRRQQEGVRDAQRRSSEEDWSRAEGDRRGRAC